MRSAAPYEVGVVAADVDALVRFYVHTLGMRVYSDVSVPVAAGAATGLSPSGYRVVRLETSMGQRFKIARAPGTSPRVAAPGYPMQTAGNFYVTFLVEDIRILHARLLDAGVVMHSAAVIEVRPGVWLFLAADPEGNFLEFVQYADLAGYLASPPPAS